MGKRLKVPDMYYYLQRGGATAPRESLPAPAFTLHTSQDRCQPSG